MPGALYLWAMALFRAATTRKLDAEQAAEDLVRQVVNQGDGPHPVAGGFLLATAAAGDQGRAVGQRLAAYWPDAELLGTSFEGVLGEGQVWRDEPALGLFVWGEVWGEEQDPPLPFVFGPDELEAARVAGELLDAVGRDTLGPSDLLLLFPDATGSPGLPAFLGDLASALGGPQLAGAAASGLAGHPALGWLGDEACPGSMVGLLLPDGGGAASPAGGLRVSAASATRAASPWLEITACRTRWVDGLDEEPPLVWVRRQLGLDDRARIEPHLDRLMARVRRLGTAGNAVVRAVDATRSTQGAASSGASETAGLAGYEEQFLIGLDARRGAISLPGEFERGDELAFSLPDAELARRALRESLEALTPSPLILQFGCRARDEDLHGDRDLESALVAHHAKGRATLGALAPFQLGPGPAGKARLLVYSTVLAALGTMDENGSI